MNKILIIIILLCISKYNFSQNDSIKTNVEFKQFFYPNGKISSEGYIKENVPVGYWKSYYITGVLKSEGKWLTNKLDSIWIFYDQVGDTIEKINYYLGQKNGYQYKFYKTDNYKNRIFSKELYVNGKRNDKSFYYYENGNIKKLIPFVNDKKQGLGFEYDNNDIIISIIRYRNNEIIEQEFINRFNTEGEKEGVWREYYKNGIIREEKTYTNGKLNGYYKLYNEEGKILEAIKYKNGILDLLSNDFETNIEIKEEYDSDENIVFQGSYKKDVPIGIHRYFNKNGKVIKSITFDINGNKTAEGIVLMNGNEDGDWTYYYENGKKQALGTFNNGNKTGKWSYYYNNGRLKQTGSYTNGKFTGSWKWYYSTGEILKEEFYVYGKLDGDAIEYSELGEIISKGNYIEGYKEGEWIYKIGDQKLKGKYVMDLKDGNWKSYYLNEEILSFEGRFLQGNEDGKHVYYYPNGKLKEERYYNGGQKVKSWSKYNEQGDLVIVIQFRDGKEYKINGVKVKFEDYEN